MRVFKKTFLLPVLLVSIFNLSSAQQFPCDGKLYFFGDNNGQTYLSSIDGYTTSTPTVQYVALIPAIYDQNALGASPVDHYIYFINRNNDNLQRIDTTGSITVACPALVHAHRATFDNHGHYWAIEDISGNNFLYEFDITTCTTIAGPFSVPFTSGMQDIAFNLFDCSLYMADGSKVIKMDTTGNLTATYPTGYNTTGTFGGIAVGSDGNLYGLKNNVVPGELYQYNLTGSSGGLVFTFPGGEANPCGCDMASFPCQILQALFDTLANCSVPDAIHFINQSTGAMSSWKWNFGDGQTDSTTLSPTHTYAQPGTYTVTLIVQQNSTCLSVAPDTFSLVVSPQAGPQANFTASNPCLGTATAFTDQSTGSPVLWDWDFGDGSSHVNQPGASHTYATSGSHTVTLIVTTLQGCKDTIVQQATVYSNPAASFSDSAKGCIPLCVIFADSSKTISGSITQWEWFFPGGNPAVSNAQSPDVCYENPGSFDVSLIVTTDLGCKDTLLMPAYITTYSWPAAGFCISNNKASIQDPSFRFCNTWSQDVVKWYWDFGDGSPVDSTNTDPVHSYSGSATNNTFYNYTVFLKVKNINGCWDTISKTIEIIPEFAFFIPTTFTPNEDNINDLFYGKGIGIKKYEIMIFDRWGNLVWECRNEGSNTDWDQSNQEGMPSACKWDGKANKGQNPAQIDVYVWKVKLTDLFNINHNYIGIVSLVK